MIRSKLLLLGALAAAATAALASPPGEKDAIAIGDKVDPTIALKDVTGKTWTLGDFQKTEDREGKIVVLDFWSIQCPISKKYEPRMKAFASKCEQKGVVFLAVAPNHKELASQGDDPYADIKEYVKKEEVAFPILADHGNRVADRFAAQTTPHVYVIDAEGVLRYQGALDDDSDMQKEKAGEPIKTYAADVVHALLKGEEPPVTSTKPVGCTIKRVSKAPQ